MSDILIIYTKSQNFSIENIFKSLVDTFEYYDSIELFLDKYDSQNNIINFDFVLLEGNLFFSLSKEDQEKLLQILNKTKIVFGGEFSESYLFTKALKLKCDEFIVTPFGLKEARDLIERLTYSINKKKN